MNIKNAHTRHAALPIALAVLLSAPAQAASVAYGFSVPTLGSGWFRYDDGALTDNGDGSYTAALTGFSFAFNGWTYTLAQGSGVDLAWFLDPAMAFVGIQYQGTRGTDAIEFTAGFGAGDLGTFTANGGAPGGIGPIALADADFTVPEPDTLACLLLGLGLGGFGRRRGKKA